MADMGFLPQMRTILDQVDGQPQTLLFSATLDGSVGAFVKDYQRDPVRYEVESPEVSVETLTQRFIGVDRRDRLEVAASICAASKRTIVFARTKHGADRLAEQLRGAGVEAAAIHGGLNQSRRERTLAAFKAGRVDALVATNVAARGLHVEAVDTVLHYDLPEDGKTYLHRSGRTARAGAEGLVVTLVTPGEERGARDLQREAGIEAAIVRMEPGDGRLRDLAAFEPPAPQPEPEPVRPPRESRDRAPVKEWRGHHGGRRPARPRERTFRR
jgi:superfamily II DNA/RNA helicase